MTTTLNEVVTCDDGCGATIEYGAARVHIDNGWYMDPALSNRVEFKDLDFVDFTHVLNYVTQQGQAIQAAIADAPVQAEPPLTVSPSETGESLS